MHHSAAGSIPSRAIDFCKQVSAGSMELPSKFPKVVVARSASRYNQAMIKHFKHKGLRLFFETGSKSGIRPDHAARLARQLRQLNDSRTAKEMNMPGWKLHQLAGELADHWSVTVNGNWRMIFVFEGEDAILVDYRDYH
jgi:proteic killer suppression protein